MNPLKIIPIEDTYLRIFEKPPKMRFTRQIIAFNYANLSPYPDGIHLSWQTSSCILVWYLKQPVATGFTVNIPEAYLAWTLFKNHTNALVLIPRKALLSVLVIKKGELVAQITRTADEGETEILDLLKREYSLHDVEIVRLLPTVSFKVKLRDAITFADFDLKPGKLLEQFVALVKIPLIAMLLITSCFYIYQETRLQSHYEKRMQHLTKLKRENVDVQSSLENVREKTSRWRDFIAKEQAYPDYYQALTGLTDVILHHGGYLNMVEYADNRLTVLTGIKSSEAAIIKDLLATGNFQEVKLLSSTKDPIKPGFQLYNLSIILRPSAAKVAS